MSDFLTHEEQLVVDALDSAELLSLEALIERLPELSWSQLFHAVDALSRRGAIELRRHGFQYQLASLTRPECVGSARV